MANNTGVWKTVWSWVKRSMRFRCSACGSDQTAKTKFCPDCGAEMKNWLNEA